MAKENATLLLIDNDCLDLNIKNIAEILINTQDNSDFIELEGNLVEKKLIGNHLPIATSARHLKLEDFTWRDMCAYADVVFVTSRTSLSKELIILALYFRILSGRSITLIMDRKTNLLATLDYYPFFLKIYSSVDCLLKKIGEPTVIPDLPALKAELRSRLRSKIESKSKNLNEINLGKFFTYTIQSPKFDLFDEDLYEGDDSRNLFFFSLVFCLNADEKTKTCKQTNKSALVAL
jgi:hypothetical protein